jgi:hypothetical protein
MKTTIAMLAAGTALLSGGQVLAPAPAFAAEAEGSGIQACPPDTFWIDRVGCVQDESGGGDPAQAGGELACDEQGIFCVSGTAPKRHCDDPNVVCVSLGDGRKPGRDNDNSRLNDGGKRGGPIRPGGAQARLPSKQRRAAEQEMAHERECEPLRDEIADLRLAATKWWDAARGWKADGRTDVAIMQQAIGRGFQMEAQLLLPELRRRGCSSGRNLKPDDDEDWEV